MFPPISLDPTLPIQCGSLSPPPFSLRRRESPELKRVVSILSTLSCGRHLSLSTTVRVSIAVQCPTCLKVVISGSALGERWLVAISLSCRREV